MYVPGQYRRFIKVSYQFLAFIKYALCRIIVRYFAAFGGLLGTGIWVQKMSCKPRLRETMLSFMKNWGSSINLVCLLDSIQIMSGHK